MPYEARRVPRHDEINVRALRYRLTRWGDLTRTPIVLLHGLQDCGDTWQFLVDRLPDTWSLVAPDWRGFGGSEWAPDGYWFPDYPADLEALLEALVPDARARVIGHSLGANIAALYSGIRPARLQWLVNLEGIGLPRTQPDAAPARYAEWLDQVKQPLRITRYRSVDQLTGILKQRNPRLPADHADFIARAWTRSVDVDSKAVSTGEVRLAFDPRHRFVNPILYRLEEAQACWSRVEIPMLLLAGTGSGHQERRLRDFNDDIVHSLFRDVQIVILPGLGHMMHHEDPQAVAEPIIEFERAHS
jgi:pimeloyl-ACP methyl ester carboxylesterase